MDFHVGLATAVYVPFQASASKYQVLITQLGLDVKYFAQDMQLAKAAMGIEPTVAREPRNFYPTC